MSGYAVKDTRTPNLPETFLSSVLHCLKAHVSETLDLFYFLNHDPEEQFGQCWDLM